MKRRILALTLALVLLLGVLPIGALAAENPFVDVSEQSYYYTPVLWAYETGVTKGIDATHFGPESTVKRSEAVTFLWRAMGEPEPHALETPFVDLKDDWYRKSVAWAVEEGITVGVDATHFDPSGTCTTMQILTFLYRTLGIGPNGWGQTCIDWATAEGLTDGTGLEISNEVFCPRGAVVTFLYRTLSSAAQMKQLPENTQAMEKEDDEVKNSTAVTDDDSALLTVDAVDVTAGTPAELHFTLTTSIVADSIPLLCNGASAGQLTDPEHSGIYTGSYTVDLAYETTLKFVAKISLGNGTLQSNEVVVRVTAPISDQTDRDIGEVLREVEARMGSVPAGGDRDAQAEARASAVFEYLQSQSGYWESTLTPGATAPTDEWISGRVDGLRRGSEATGDPYTIYYTIDGIRFSAECREEDEDIEGGYAVPESVNENRNALSGGWYDLPTEIGNKVMVLSHFGESDTQLMTESAKATVKTLKDAGFDVDSRFDFKVSDFKGLEDYSIIIVRSHGKDCRVCTEEVVTSSNLKTYSSELKSNAIEIVTYWNGYSKYYIRPEFFTRYYKDSGTPLKAAWVHFGMCEGRIDSTLADAVLNAGAETVTSFNNSVYTTYSTDMIATMLKKLLKGDTMQQAVDAAKQVHGQDDGHSGIWAASLIIDGNANLKTRPLDPLQNGNFDFVRNLFGFKYFSPYTAWKWAGDAKPAYSKAGYRAYGQYMAVLTTGKGSLENETFSIIDQPIYIPEGATTLNFSFRVMTEEYSKLGTGTPLNNDCLRCALLDEDGRILLNLFSFSVNIHRGYLRSTHAMLGQTPCGITNWYAVQRDVSAYSGKIVNLAFWVADAGDSWYDTAAFVDNVVIK